MMKNTNFVVEIMYSKQKPFKIVQIP